MRANPFVLCNMASKATRIIHRPDHMRVEETIKLAVQTSEKHLTSGTEEEVRIKNLRLYEHER